MTATARQIGAIHTIAKRLGLADENYRELLAATTGKRSARELSFSEAGAVIDRLKGLRGGADAPSNAAGAREASRRDGRERPSVDGPYGPKARALWISGYHLGVVRERSDAAMFAFIGRQTGMAHTRWLRDPADGSRVVEALKSWLAREGGVVWPRTPAGEKPDPLAAKRAVIAAQWRRLVELGSVRPIHGSTDHLGDYIGAVARGAPCRAAQLDDPSLTGAELDAVMEALGGRLRRALAQAAAAAPDPPGRE